MKKILDLNFCTLIYSDKDVNREKKLITDAFNYNTNFYKIKIPKFEIQFVYSRNEFDKMWGKKTLSFVSAFARDKKIIIFAHSIFDKSTIWKKEKFSEGLIHEINHLFYRELRNDEYDPLWLSEGLATFLQHHKKRFNYKKKLKIKKEILEESFENMTIDSYQIYTLFVEFLIFKYGEREILNLIKRLKDGEKLNNIFLQKYNKSFDELIKDGNKYQKTA